ncbi:MAG: B12-binding domain-containing radical SAM protein [Chlorobium phaeobacteroides]|nr:B12-binding domain-containing radical SAM protein [Chlorobium phaeobacteroides]MBL6955337.1 B12-binding domain-containing radical SAM protein [Chlorobium phaeobacteroides]
MEISAPLGILGLASMVQRECKNIDTTIINLNKLYLEYLKEQKSSSKATFVDTIIDHIETCAPSPDVMGFSTICSSYPLTLRLATLYKKRHSNTTVILGGPQASATDLASIKAFPEIDMIFRGEAEYGFVSFLESMQENKPGHLYNIKGLTFRNSNNIIRNANADPVMDLDSLPVPAYDLDPYINNYKTLSLEIGRGCPYSCSFCSTSTFFGRKFRLKSPGTILDQMRFIKRKFGIDNIGLDHDMFSADRKKVRAFCETLIASGEKFYWGCSARVDCVDNDLLALMAQAGCNGIFFGIESASKRMQKSINKNLDLANAVDTIAHADKMGIKSGVSLITAFPDETDEELNNTLNFFIGSLRFDNAAPQIGILAPLAGSPLYNKHKDELVLDHIFSEMSFQGWTFDDQDLTLIEQHPEVFPDFYSIPNPEIPRREFKQIRDFVTALQVWFRWLPVAMQQESANMLKISRHWIQWCVENNIPEKIDDEIPYYCHRRFADDFLRFINDVYIPRLSSHQEIIAELTKTEGFFHPYKDHPEDAKEETVSGSESDTMNDDKGGTTIASSSHLFSLASYPYIPDNVLVTDLNIDYKKLLECLRKKEDLKRVKQNKVTIAFREIEHGDIKIQVRQLSTLSKEILHLCNGLLSISEIISLFSQKHTQINGVPVQKAATFMLIELFKQGLITLCDEKQEGKDELPLKSSA